MLQRFFFGNIQAILNTSNDCENQNFEMFEEVIHNHDKSDGDIIQ